MLNKIRNYELLKGLMTQAAAVALVFWVFAATGNAQTTGETMPVTAQNQQTVETKPAPALMPVLNNYKEIKIGTTAEEVRDKLGKAKIDDKDGFFYEISDDEFAQIRVDKDQKVRLISSTYTDDNKNTPKYTDVFGADAVAPAKPDGSIYNLINYPESGYWVAYSRTAGDKPTVTVTMQKMRMAKTK